MADPFTTVSSTEVEKHHLTVEDSGTSALSRTAIIYGAIAGVLMSIFISVSGYYITGDNAGFGYLKYLILGAALYPVLLKTKAATVAGESMKTSVGTGMLASASAGVVSALAVIIFNGKKALSEEVEGAADVAGNQFVLAGITFFLCLVAGMILTLIMMQFLKDDRPAK